MNEVTDVGQNRPELVLLSDGNHVAVWDGPEDVYARIFEPVGTDVTGDFRVTTYKADNQNVPVSGGDGSLAVLAGGRLLVA